MSNNVSALEQVAPARALEHLWPHQANVDWAERVRGRETLVFDSGKGCMITDTSGRDYLDAFSGLCVVNVGHGRTEMGEAMARQASKIAYTNPSQSVSTVTVALADKIAELTPGDLNRVLFCSGGSEAVETAIKIAKQVQALRGFPRRYKLIARRGSYHGATAGAMAITQPNSERFHGPFAPGASIVPSPNHYRNDFGLDGEAGDLMCARYVEQEILAQGPELVAAVIAEPISISNGTHIPSPAYWGELRAICDRYGVLLIADEVVTGYGRTGAAFAMEHFGVVPDLMTMAKGLSSGYAPIGAVAVRDSVFEPFLQPGNHLSHMLSFGGSAVSHAVALKNIEIVEREALVARSAEQGAKLRAMLNELRNHPTVGDIRGGLGLLCSIDLVKNTQTKERWDPRFSQSIDEALRSRGIITRVFPTLHLAPPLVVSDDELARLVHAVDESISEAEAEFAAEIS